MNDFESFVGIFILRLESQTLPWVIDYSVRRQKTGKYCYFIVLFFYILSWG